MLRVNLGLKQTLPADVLLHCIVTMCLISFVLLIPTLRHNQSRMVLMLAVFVSIIDSNSLSTLDTDFSSVGIEQVYIYINDNDMDIFVNICDDV